MADGDHVRVEADSTCVVNSATHTQTNAGGTSEQMLYEKTGVTTRKHVTLLMDLANLTQNTTIRVYEKVDGTTYRVVDPTKAWTTSTPPGVRVDFYATADWKITLASAVTEASDRSVPYRYSEG